MESAVRVVDCCKRSCNFRLGRVWVSGVQERDAVGSGIATSYLIPLFDSGGK